MQLPPGIPQTQKLAWGGRTWPPTTVADIPPSSLAGTGQELSSSWKSRDNGGGRWEAEQVEEGNMPLSTEGVGGREF